MTDFIEQIIGLVLAVLLVLGLLLMLDKHRKKKLFEIQLGDWLWGTYGPITVVLFAFGLLLSNPEDGSLMVLSLIAVFSQLVFLIAGIVAFLMSIITSLQHKRFGWTSLFGSIIVILAPVWILNYVDSPSSSPRFPDDIPRALTRLNSNVLIVMTNLSDNRESA